MTIQGQPVIGANGQSITTEQPIAPSPADEELTIPESEEELAKLLEEGAEGEPEEEVIEYKGKKLKLDPDAKWAWNDWQGDYTRKTMALSEKEKAIQAREAALNTAASFQATVVKDIAKLESLDEHLKEFAQVTPQQWEAAYAQDEKAAAAAERQYNRLKAQRAELENGLRAKAAEWQNRQGQTSAEQKAQAERELAMRVKGYTPEKYAASKKAFADIYGFTEAELAGSPLLADPRVAQAIEDIVTVKQALLKARTKAATQTEAPVVPLNSPTPPRSRGAPTNGPRDTQSPDVWLREFNKMMAARRRGAR